MKKKGLALAVCIALTAPNIVAAETFSGIAALNLGDIHSKSYLDEPFKGSIPILYTSAEEASQLKVRLASHSIFNELGVEKFPILNSLSFKIKLGSNGKPYVAIRSSQAIDLPFLSFVVEIYGTEGSIYQDYTVLLDPRSYASNNGSNTPAVVSSVNKTRETFVNTSANKTHPKRLRVKAGDTLSTIANDVRLPEISNKNMARAIFLKNPRAFSGKNVNKLKKGVTLKIPSLKELENPKQTVNDITETKTASIKSTTIEKPVTIKEPTLTTDGDALTYKVKGGDTLSGISRKHASKTVSFSKMMTAIHKDNPHAFTNNKINLLKKGAILSIPTGALLIKTNNQQPEKKVEIVKSSLKKGKQEIESNTYKVVQGDTLGTIVKRLGYKRSDSAKAMKALYRKNKKAFNKKDITSIKTGATLNLLNKGDAKKLLKTQKEPIIKVTSSVESTIINSLNSLEKRLRELRKELKSSQSKLFDLNLTLKNKDALLQRQSKDIIILKKKLSSIKSIEENPATPTLVKDTDNEISTEDILESNITEKEFSNAEMITYSGLALLIGLMLLRVGRQKYAEKMVAADDYVPTAKINPRMAPEQLDFKNTLVNSGKKKTEINEASIKECELLVDELVDELDYKLAATHHDNHGENKADNHSVKTIQEQHHEVNQVNNLIEDLDYKQPDKTLEKESDAIKIDILSNLEESVEKKLQPQPSSLKNGKSPQRDDLVTLEIDLERHLQSINDQIIANKMKDHI